MAIQKRPWNDAKLHRFIQDGRGSGEGKEYKPWLTVHDQPSRGRVTRIHGWKTDRIHHFLADQELRLFYLLEYSESVQDIREHYPLLDLYEMNYLFDEGMLDKLIDRRTGTPHVLTTSFLITESDGRGGVRYKARSIKDPKELEKSSVLERFELTRRYWQEKNVEWKLINPNLLPRQHSANIEWVHSAYRLDGWMMEGEQPQYYLPYLIERFQAKGVSVRQVLEQFEQELKTPAGMGLLLYRHLIATKQILIDMDCPIDLNILVETIQIRASSGGRESSYATGS
ncbi:heteromeric transposase endonuclease subunit TnsA [Brevibacillus borstelensis]|uniref:TnsA endonuclease C-terminal domain-containing protein n=1 Tax=Brevibacillus borstelensis TaxID=45462 RepID=UPI00148F64BB|nr:heteromeric transposase endonuclease subunit TnsA [Brevibacillus borstelensis]